MGPLDILRKLNRIYQLVLSVLGGRCLLRRLALKLRNGLKHFLELFDSSQTVGSCGYAALFEGLQLLLKDNVVLLFLKQDMVHSVDLWILIKWWLLNNRG